MQGSIRLGVGFLMVFGAVGGMENNPEASLPALILVAVIGLLLMFSGTKAMNNE
jgi:heme O synthase-like polyprenyltransferase